MKLEFTEAEFARAVQVYAAAKLGRSAESLAVTLHWRGRSWATYCRIAASVGTNAMGGWSGRWRAQRMCFCPIARPKRGLWLVPSSFYCAT